MESKNAQFLRDGLIDSARKMTPMERVNAFVEHSRRMRGLMVLGEKRREGPTKSESKPNG